MTFPLTPHGPGFSFIDRFASEGPGAGTGWKFLPSRSPFFADHFPGNPMLPAVLLVECAAQAAGTAWMHRAGSKPGTALFLASIERFRVKSAVAPDSTVRTKVEMIKETGGLAVFAVCCFVDETEVAIGQLILSTSSGRAGAENASPSGT